MPEATFDLDYCLVFRHYYIGTPWQATCNRNRNPSLWSALRTIISGFVSLDRMHDICFERADVALIRGVGISSLK